MDGGRNGLRRNLWLALSLLLFASCSTKPLTDDGVPAACDLPLPHRCDICSTGETVCAHYVVRNGVCAVETCPATPSLPDASMPSFDGSMDVVTQVGPSYPCGPSGTLQCSCGLEPYFPAPVNEAGQQQTFVLTPDPATVVGYHSMAEFDALAVGRWRRTAGQGELVCEQYGLEFTADHRLIPLVIASDGSVQGVTAQARSFSIGFDNGGLPDRLGTGSLTTNPPTFFDRGASMYFLFSPWPANYARAP